MVARDVAIVRSAVRLVTVLLATAMAVPWLFQSWWLASLASHFLLHVALAAVLTGLLGIVCRARQWAIVCAGMVVVAIIQVNRTPVAPAEPVSGLSLLSQNLSSWNHQKIRALEMLTQASPDIIVLQEYTPAWHVALGSVRRDYPHGYFVTEGGAFGIAVMSRIPLSNAIHFEVGEPGVPVIDIAVASDQFDGRILTVHFEPPMTRESFDTQRRQMADLAGVVDSIDAEFVVAGDFNNTPYSPGFRRFLARTNTRLAPPEWRATWPHILGLFGIPIDHLLASSGVSTSNKKHVLPIGSDHRGFVIEIATPSTGSDGGRL